MRELSVSAASEPGEDFELVDAAAQVSAWCGEPLLYDGDDPAVALAPGTARRRALDAAREEIAQGLDAPSPTWRFRFSLMLGLERVLAAESPALLNGLTLRPHQVDALAGMLAALTSNEEREADLDEGDADEDELNGHEDDGEGDAEADDADEDEDDERTRTTRTRTRTTKTPRRPPTASSASSPRSLPTRTATTRRRSPRSPRSTIRARRAAIASSTRRPRARRWPPPASSRPVARWACSSSPIAGCSSTSSCAISRSRATARA